MMKKVLITIVSICVAGLVVVGGFFAFKALSSTQADEVVYVEEMPDVLVDMPPAKNDADIYDNLDYAVQKNQDTIAWIEIPETDINNMVMQGDDNDYYLRRNEDKKDDIYGCYFADYECAFGGYDDFSQNTIIYGHSDSIDNPNGKKFAQLHRFTDPEFAKKVPYIYLTTPQGKYKFEIFSVFYADVGVTSESKFDYIQVNIDEQKKLEIAELASSLSIHDYGLEPNLSDKLLTLSTCTVQYGEEVDYRFVVMAKLCPEE